MKKKTGFTLIELLAVIVILAIIALIATPIILGVIEDSKKKSRENSIAGYVETVKLEVTKYALNNNGENPIFNEEYIKSIIHQGDKITCGLDGEIPGVYYSNQYGVVLHGCTVGNDNTLYYYGNGVYTSKDDSKYQEIFDKVTGGVSLKGNSIESYVKDLVYSGDSCKTDGTTYQYMGGCYLKGASTTNYAWYSGFLWRIMGINSDGTIKLITEENISAGSYNVADTGIFEGSYVDKWLNDYFLKHLKGTDIITNGTFCQGVATDVSSSKRTDCTGGKTLTRKVGALSIDEHNLSGNTSSYLKSGQSFWTISPKSTTSLWFIDYVGLIYGNNSKYPSGIRPVININANTKVTQGNGTISMSWDKTNSPYVINENKDINIAGNLGDKAISGEYVMFGDKEYRIVSQENGATKLISEGIYQEPAGTDYEMLYGTDNTFSTTSGVGQKLNTDVLNYLAPTTELKNRILPSTWYQNILDSGMSYEVSLNETNPTRKIENTKVGLIRVGEFLATQSYIQLTKNMTIAVSYNNVANYWTMNSKLDAANWGISSQGGLIGGDVGRNSYALRPVIQVSSTSTILSGNGTPGNPYKI